MGNENRVTPGDQPTKGEEVKSTQQTEQKVARKTRVKSAYLFPMYDFNTAKLIADTIERDGAGNLTEETLAIALGSSVKSSGFQLKALTARQFGLVTKQGNTLSTTNLEKAIFKPTSEVEKQKALVESFLKIPLFREVANRFKGQSLPSNPAFRNILEREFKIANDRVADAERVLMDSAQDTGVLVRSGSLTYISVEKAGSIAEAPSSSMGSGEGEEKDREEHGTGGTKGEKPQRTMQLAGFLPAIAEEDLLSLEQKDFDIFWAQFGKILRARAQRSKPQGETTKKEPENK